MKTLDDFANMLDKWASEIDEKAEKGLEKTAQQVWEDIIENAPMGTGNYISSIRIFPIEKQNNGISIFIGSDMMVGPTKWGDIDGSQNAPSGTMYNLGYLLEHGTFEHAIPNAFGYGFYHNFTDASGKYHKGTLDKDWHPGTIAQPHYSLAIEKNKKLFKDNIMKEVTWR